MWIDVFWDHNGNLKRHLPNKIRTLHQRNHSKSTSFSSWQVLYEAIIVPASFFWKILSFWTYHSLCRSRVKNCWYLSLLWNFRLLLLKNVGFLADGNSDKGNSNSQACKISLSIARVNF